MSCYVHVLYIHVHVFLPQPLHGFFFNGTFVWTFNDFIAEFYVVLETHGH